MASPTIANRESNQQALWALVPFGTRSPISKPIFFHSPEEVKQCMRIPIFVGWGEQRNLETRADWLQAIASDVAVPPVPSDRERWRQDPTIQVSPGALVTHLPPPEIPDVSCKPLESSKSATEAAAKLADHYLSQHGFATYRLYMSHPEKNCAARICRRYGCATCLTYLKWRRRRVNFPDMFVSMPVPVHRMADTQAPFCNLHLSEYIKPGELNLVPGDLKTSIGSCLANPLVPYMQCLYPDWNFLEIQRRAARSHWHQAPKRKLKIENAREYFARVALELDAALRSWWPNLSAAALQAFWTSWEVSEHLRDVERGIEEYASEPGAVSADIGGPGEARTAIESIIRHYVIDCLEEPAAHSQAMAIPGPQTRKRRQTLRSPAELNGIARQKRKVGESNGEVAKAPFASKVGRNRAVAAYIEDWDCSQASLARTARVHPSDLCKWKRGRLPATSGKKARIEKALRNNDSPTFAAQKNSNT
jgi:hypothetical protein